MTVRRDISSHQDVLDSLRQGRYTPEQCLMRLTVVTGSSSIMFWGEYFDAVKEVFPQVVWNPDGKEIELIGFSPVVWKGPDDFYNWADRYLGYAFSTGNYLRQFIDGDDTAPERLTKHEQMIARAEKVRELREQGMTQQAIADELGVSRRTVNSDMCAEKSVQTQKPAQPRKVTQYTVTQYTKPETAAQKIRDKFGDEFAFALGTLLVSPQ